MNEWMNEWMNIIKYKDKTRIMNEWINVKYKDKTGIMNEWMLKSTRIKLELWMNECYKVQG